MRPNKVETGRGLSISCNRSVILKVGEIAPLGAISKDKGAKKTKGAIGGRKIMKGAKTLIDR